MSNRWRTVLNTVRIVIAVIVLGCVVKAVTDNWHAVSVHFGQVQPLAGVGAVFFALLSPVLTLFGWRMLMTDLGSRLPIPAAASVFFVGQLGKYLPGSVWSVMAQADMAAALKVPRRRSTVVGILSIILAVITGGIVGLPAVPALMQRDAQVSWPVVVFVVIGGALLLFPPVLNWLITVALRIVRMEPLETPLTTKAVAVTSAWMTLAWASTGVSVFILSRSMAPASDIPTDDSDWRSFVVMTVCGYCLAATIGMLTIISPAGVGVRDGILLLLLAAVLTNSVAGAVVVLSRSLTVLADVVCAVGGWMWGRQHHLLDARTRSVEGESRGPSEPAHRGSSGRGPAGGQSSIE